MSRLVIADARAGRDLLGVGGEREDRYQDQGEQGDEAGLAEGQG